MGFGNHRAPLRISVFARARWRLSERKVWMLAGVNVILRCKRLQLRERASNPVVFFRVLGARLYDANLRQYVPPHANHAIGASHAEGDLFDPQLAGKLEERWLREVGCNHARKLGEEIRRAVDKLHGVLFYGSAFDLLVQFEQQVCDHLATRLPKALLRDEKVVAEIALCGSVRAHGGAAEVQGGRSTASDSSPRGKSGVGMPREAQVPAQAEKPAAPGRKQGSGKTGFDLRRAGCLPQ